jgi:hypothetical protein
MKISHNKIAAMTIVILFILSMIASMTLVPNAKAHSPPLNIPTYAYINASPNPAGLGQTITLGFFINDPPPTAAAQFGDRWQNFKVTVTKPDGTTENLGPFTSDDTGGTSTLYTPSQLGNYTFVFSFPGQTLAGNNLAPGTATNPFVGDYYGPSTAKTTLLVQQNAVPTIPENPLPTSYWTRPINSVNDLWSTISGNWLGLGVSTFANTGQYNSSGNYNPYTLAPHTAHILWTQPAAPGGQIGGEFGGDSLTHFYAPAQYEPKFAPIIIDGVLYYEVYPGSSSDPTGWAAVDLHTGQTLWVKNTTVGSTLGPILRCGQTLNYVSPNQYGAFAYLWATGNPFGVPTLTGNMLTVPAAKQTILNPGTYASITTTLTGTTYSMYDAVSGGYILSIVNCTAMTLIEDNSGDLIGYYVNAANPNAPTLNMWNSTRAILLNQPAQYYGQTSADAWFWRPPSNGIIPFADGIQWTAPIATNISGVAFPQTFANNLYLNTTLAISGNCIENGVVLMTDSSGIAGGFQAGFIIEAGYSADTGQQLWITNRTETPYTRTTTIPATAGVYAEVNYNTAVITGYSMTSGTQVWGPVSLPNPNPYDSIGGYQYVSANGTCYLWGFGGTIYAINMATGAINWATTTEQISGPSGTDTPYGVWPLWTFSVGTVANGILFVPEGHQYSPPMFRGSSFLALNTTNGEPVWSILGFNIESPPAISDGVMTTLNCYDNQIYAYGMGPTKVTVTAPSIEVTTSTPITISGTVTDISAGSLQNAVAANFPNGLPCVSDDSMTPFMEAVYEQQAMPHNITGVPVTISVTDSNGNYRDIGTTTSNAYGTYSLTWTPNISGDYSVTATFAGTQSYYPSSAATAFHASSTPTTPAPTTAAASNFATTTDFMIGVAAIIVVIIIIGAILAMLMLRKRP